MRRWVGLLALLLAGCQPAGSPPPAEIPVAAAVDPFADLKLAGSAPSLAPGSATAVPEVGKPMPDFLLPSIEGPPHRLSDWRGKPTIVAFWAFWCSTWKEVNAGFDTVAIQAGTRCHLVTVDIDCQWKDQLTRPREVPYVALMDPRSEVSKRWDIGAVPTVFVVDSHGVLCQRYQGYPGNAALGAWIDRLQQGANP